MGDGCPGAAPVGAPAGSTVKSTVSGSAKSCLFAAAVATWAAAPAHAARADGSDPTALVELDVGELLNLQVTAACS